MQVRRISVAVVVLALLSVVGLAQWETFGPFAGITGDDARFSVAVPVIPNTYITGILTERTGRPLAGVPIRVYVKLEAEHASAATSRQPTDIVFVIICVPGYPNVTLTHYWVRGSFSPPIVCGYAVDVGTVSLQPPTPISGTTDEDGKFRVTIAPGVVVTGRLTVCTVTPIPNELFSVVPQYGGDCEISGFTFAVPGYAETTVTQFRESSLFWWTSYALGDLHVPPSDSLEQILEWLSGPYSVTGEIQVIPPPPFEAVKVGFSGSFHLTLQLDERGEVLLYESQLEFIVESFSLPADVAGEATQTGLIRIALNPDVIQIGRYNPATCAFWMRIGLFVTISAIGGPYPVMVVGEGTLDLITRAYESRGTFSILEGPFAGLDGVYAKGSADCYRGATINLTLKVGEKQPITLPYKHSLDTWSQTTKDTVSVWSGGLGVPRIAIIECKTVGQTTVTITSAFGNSSATCTVCVTCTAGSEEQK